MAGDATCPNCGKVYPWKEALAGKNVRCKDCSETFRFPHTTEPAADDGGYELNLDEPPAPENYELKNDPLAAPTSASGTSAAGNCPSCGNSVAAGAVICVNCGFNIAQGTQMQTETGIAGDDEHIDEEPELKGGARALADEELRLENREKWINYIIPIGLIIFGFMIAIPVGVARGDAGTGTTVRLIQSIGSIIISVPVMLGSLFIAAKLLDLSFGTLSTALLKLCAIAVAPGAFHDVVWFICGQGLMGWFYGAIVSFCVYWALLAKLFEMEAADAWKVIVIIFFTRYFSFTIFGYFLYWMLGA